MPSPRCRSAQPVHAAARHSTAPWLQLGPNSIIKRHCSRWVCKETTSCLMNSCQFFFATCLLRIKCFCTLLLRAVLFHQLMRGCIHVGGTHPWCVNHALDSKQLCKAWQAGIGPSCPQEYLDPQHQRASIVSQGAVLNEGCFIYPQAGNSGSSRYGDKMSPVRECSCLAIDPWWHSALEWKATQIGSRSKKIKSKSDAVSPDPK